jgi:signal peptidase II
VAGFPFRRFAGPLLVAVLIAVADQATKAWIVRNLALYEARAVLADYFHIIHVRNRGMAFSLLADLSHPWFTPLLLFLTVLAIGGVLWYLYLHPQRGPAPIGLGLILGGAIGNLIDRARWGYVVDFIDVHWKNRHWPAFNVADIGITVGVLLLILDLTVWPGKEGDASGSRQDRKP